MQQFSTPAALSWLAARTAAIMTDDHVLEPSAGTGMLAAHAIAAGASVSLNERDPCRAALLSLVTSRAVTRSEEHTSELQSLMRISYAVFCLKKKNKKTTSKDMIKYRLPQTTTSAFYTLDKYRNHR